MHRSSLPPTPDPLQRGSDLPGLHGRATGQPYTLPESSRPWNPERLEKALNTVLADEGLDTVMQLERISKSEALTSGRRAYDDAMSREHRVQGWVRGLDGNACQLCTWWWREGQVWHRDHPMPEHTGCLCHPVPTMTKASNFDTPEQSVQAMQEQEDRKAND